MRERITVISRILNATEPKGSFGYAHVLFFLARNGNFIHCNRALDLRTGPSLAVFLYSFIRIRALIGLSIRLALPAGISIHIPSEKKIEPNLRLSCAIRSLMYMP